ncbi:hypothetical protein [Microbacterium paludicola]|uniref:hypothetical protein n=1 Tax=Microbacterium paludicola TaxID=300019 RepID=UPI0031D3A335
MLDFSDSDYADLLPLVTAERLGSYVRATDGEAGHAFALYEWNMRASASVIELSSMLEVITRNAMDQELRAWARARAGGRSWLDAAPLDARGRQDIAKARDRATKNGRRAEVHGRVVAELTLGFWRYIPESRYLTSLWVPSVHAAFPHGVSDLRQRQRDVAFRFQQLHFVRNRAAHHEPIHQRDLIKDYDLAVELAEWVAPAAARWVRKLSTLPAVVAARPTF